MLEAPQPNRGIRDCLRVGIVLGICLAAFDAVFMLLVTQSHPRFDGTYIIDIGRTILTYGVTGFVIGVIGAGMVVLGKMLPSRRIRSAGYSIIPATWAYILAVGFLVGYLGKGTGPDQELTNTSVTFVAAALSMGFWWFGFRRVRWGRTNTVDWAKLRTNAIAVSLALASTAAWSSGRGRHDFIEGALAGMSAPASESKADGRPNVLLITVDTLRADHLGPYGYTRIDTPSFNRLADGGIVFEQMIAQSSWTRSSFGSIMTSRSPSHHGANWMLDVGDGVGRNDTVFSDGLRPELPTLAQILNDAGYRTAAINTNIQTAAMFGFDKGFDYFVDYSRPISLLQKSLLCKGFGAHTAGACDDITTKDEEYEYQPAPVVLSTAERVLESLEESGEPFFLWVHFMDPHGPYKPHTSDREAINYGHLKEWLHVESADLDAVRERLVAAYDEEIVFLDEHIGRLLDRLESSPKLSNTVVGLTADHGEEFVERWRPLSERGGGLHFYNRGYGHGHTMYDEVIRVPLLLRFPDGRYAGARIPWVAQQLDVAPTLIAATGVSVDDNAMLGFEGLDLATYLGRDTAPPERSAKSEANCYSPEVKSIRDDSHKFVYRSADDVTEFYDLLADPGEERDASRTRNATAMGMGRALTEWVATLPLPPIGDADAQNRNAAGAGVEDRLRALGYVE